MIRIYDDFSEVESEVKEKAPKVVYKVRTWGSEIHKSLLRDYQLWFPHPFDTNDPLDTRPVYQFDQSEIESPEFYDRLIAGAPSWDEFGVNTEEEFQQRCREQWDKIKLNPQAHFDANRENVVLTRERFEQIGIFSTTTNGIHPETWGLYGDNYSGYAVGFNTSELAKELNCSIGMVEYSDEPFQYSFLGRRDDIDEYLYKTKKWEYESEFRFFTVRIGLGVERLRTFSPEIVAEIILGHNLALEAEKEILEIIATKYPATVKVYKTTINKDGTVSKVLVPMPTAIE